MDKCGNLMALEASGCLVNANRCQVVPSQSKSSAHGLDMRLRAPKKQQCKIMAPLEQSAGSEKEHHPWSERNFDYFDAMDFERKDEQRTQERIYRRYKLDNRQCQQRRCRSQKSASSARACAV